MNKEISKVEYSLLHFFWLLSLLVANSFNRQYAFFVDVFELGQELLDHVKHALSVERQFLPHEHPAGSFRQGGQQDELVLVVFV